MVRNDPTADVSLAAMRERNRFGMAMAAMMRMMATTINSSMRENPFCFCMNSPFNFRFIRTRGAHSSAGGDGRDPYKRGGGMRNLKGEELQCANMQCIMLIESI